MLPIQEHSGLRSVQIQIVITSILYNIQIWNDVENTLESLSTYLLSSSLALYIIPTLNMFPSTPFIITIWRYTCRLPTLFRSSPHHIWGDLLFVFSAMGPIVILNDSICRLSVWHCGLRSSTWVWLHDLWHLSPWLFVFWLFCQYFCRCSCLSTICQYCEDTLVKFGFLFVSDIHCIQEKEGHCGDWSWKRWEF